MHSVQDSKLRKLASKHYFVTSEKTLLPIRKSTTVPGVSFHASYGAHFSVFMRSSWAEFFFELPGYFFPTENNEGYRMGNTRCKPHHLDIGLWRRFVYREEIEESESGSEITTTLSFAVFQKLKYARAENDLIPRVHRPPLMFLFAIRSFFFCLMSSRHVWRFGTAGILPAHPEVEINKNYLDWELANQRELFCLLICRHSGHSLLFSASSFRNWTGIHCPVWGIT